MLDRNGDPSDKLVVYIKQKEHDPTAKTSEELSRRIVVAISDDDNVMLDEGIIRACVFLHWDNRDVADLAVDRLLNLVSEKEFRPGFERSNIGPWLGLNRKDFAYWLGSKLEPYQSFTMYRSGGDQNEHIIGRGSPMFDQSDLLMNPFRAKWSYSNTMIEHKFLNIEKNCHHVNADEMVLISEDGSRMSARSFYSRGGEPQTNFSHWEHRPELVLVDEEAASFDAPLTDLKAISLHLRHSTEVTDPLVLSKELESLHSKLVEEASFVGEHRSSDPKVSDEELMQEIRDSESQSLDRLVPVLIGASRNEQPGCPPPPIMHSFQQIPSAVVADVDDDLDAADSQSQEEEEEISSLETASASTKSDDVIDILDLRAIAKSKHLDLVKRIEVAYFEATIKTDVQFHLMFGQYDVWSVMNIAKSDFSRNKSSVRACEMQLRAFLLLMQDRSTANAHAKSYRLAALEERKKAELKSIDIDADHAFVITSTILSSPPPFVFHFSTQKAASDISCVTTYRSNRVRLPPLHQTIL